MDCPHAEVFFGGARGGGKTDGVLGKWALKEQRYGENFNAIMFRKTTVSAEDAVERARAIYEPLGAKFVSSPPRFRMPNGGRVSFQYLERVQDADNYQGRNVTDAWVEEAGQYADPGPIDRLNAVLRSPQGVPTQLILTGNPGGAGQHWLAKRYGLIPLPRGPQVVERTLPNGNVHKAAVIPSRLSDNQILMRADPDYEDRLYMSGPESLVKAWLDGDWTAVEGAFFDVWDSRMILRPFEVPEHWLRFRAMDWGSARPFSVGWWAIASDDYIHEGVRIPRGALLRYREWYGASEPNVGLKLTAEAVRDGILDREEKGETISYGVCDPAMFAEDGGPSIAERMRPIFWKPADNARVARQGHMGGWDQMRQRMRDGMLFTFETCRESIRTIPVLQHDRNRAEDLDTHSEDHCFAAGTLVETSNGLQAIESLPESGWVWSLGGMQQYRSARMTRKSASVVRVVFDDGAEIVCTPDHKFYLSQSEWRYAKDLSGLEVLCVPTSSATLSKSLKGCDSIGAADTFSAKASGYTGLCGDLLTETFRRAATFITSTATQVTTRWKTWNAFRQQSTLAGGMALSQGVAVAPALPTLVTQRLPGTHRQRADSGTASITRSTSPPSCAARFLQRAMSAAVNTWSLLRGQSRGNIVLEPARRARCVSVVPLSEPQDVYCLTVPTTGCFALQGGKLVSNCADEWRYACMSRPYAPVGTPQPKVDRDPWGRRRSNAGDWRTM